MNTQQQIATDHVATMDVLAGLTRSLALLPLREARETIERAHALGPIMDPTGYMRGLDNLHDQAALLDAAIALQDVAKRIAGGAK